MTNYNQVSYMNVLQSFQNINAQSLGGF